MRLPVRRRVAGRRARRPAGRGIRLATTARLAGGAMVVVACAAWLFLTDPGRFQLDEQRLEIRGLVHTRADAVRRTIGLPVGEQPNLFSLRTDEMQRRLVELPAVAAADVRAVLPDGLVVAVEERQPVLVWRAARTDFLVDADGVLVDQTGPRLPPLPVVEDRRSSDTSASLAVGDVLEPIDLAVVLRLAAVTPELVGSGAQRLDLSIDDEDGYVMASEPESWRAVFGHYTPTLRPPEIIDQQVQCLRSLLADGEANIEVVYLATADDRCGTYRPRPTPLGGPSPTDGASPGEDPTASPEP